jgi:hypothetical protein
MSALPPEFIPLPTERRRRVNAGHRGIAGQWPACLKEPSK